MTEADIRAKILVYGEACYKGGSRGELFTDLITSIHQWGEQCFLDGEYVALNFADSMRAQGASNNPPEITFD